MAIQSNYKSNRLDTDFLNAYWKISKIYGDKTKITYVIEVYKNANHAHSDAYKSIDMFEYSFKPNLKPNSPNFIEQAYNHAKSLSMLQGGVDM